MMLQLIPKKSGFLFKLTQQYRPMKKLLTSIAGSTLLTLTALVIVPEPSQALLFSSSDSTDLDDLLNQTDLNHTSKKKTSLTTEWTNVLNTVSQPPRMTPTTLLHSPSETRITSRTPVSTSSAISEASSLYTVTTVNSSSLPGGKEIYSKKYGKGVCNVNAVCALKAIGFSLTMKCSSAGTDPEAWAKCLKSKDHEKFLAAAQCTWGSCPAFSTLPNGGAAYACTSPTEPIFLGGKT